MLTCALVLVVSVSVGGVGTCLRDPGSPHMQMWSSAGLEDHLSCCCSATRVMAPSGASQMSRREPLRRCYFTRKKLGYSQTLWV